jgi:hypothetical protein
MTLFAHAGGPVDFGMAELNAAMAARNMKYKPRIMTEINLEPPETFRIEPYTAGGGRIAGGDLRGLMYGLLEAAEQMRATGHLKQTHGMPSINMRGVKIAADPTAAWFVSENFWSNFLPSLARGRFNRLQIAFERPPARELFPIVRTISQSSLQYGVDIVLGLTSLPADFGPGLLELLAQCAGIRSLSLTGDAEAMKAPIAEVLGKAGRRVVLENRLWQIDPAQNAEDEASVRAVVSTLTRGFEVGAPVDKNSRPTAQEIRHWGRLGYGFAPEPKVRSAR